MVGLRNHHAQRVSEPEETQSMKFVACTLQAHGNAILDIFNEQIRTSTGLYDYEERTPESMVAWFKTKEEKGYPVIGVEDDAGVLMGFASYGVFRERPANKY